MDRKTAPIGVFDSGVGGVTTLKSCMERLPEESFVYLADSSGMPYGLKDRAEIERRVFACVERLIEEGVKAVVVACNTATNAEIERLRKCFSLPFVGLEPALKPAIEQCRSKNVLVLLTPATAAQEKFQQLMRRYDNGKVIVAPQPSLASEVEKNIDNIESLRCEVYRLLRPYRDIEGVVLGCTHYVFLKQLIYDFYGGSVKLFDGNLGAARRLEAVLQSADLLAYNTVSRSIKFIVT